MRSTIIITLALLLPTIVYFLYIQAMRHSGNAGGTNADGRYDPWWKVAPWPWLAVAGVTMVAIVLMGMVVFGEHTGDGEYIPARLVNGKLVGGIVVPNE